MQFSQIALIVLIVMAMITRYIPLWLGIVTIAVWAAAKLLMRALINQMERRELAKHRLSGAQIDVHCIDVVRDAHENYRNASYRLEFSVRPKDAGIEWRPDQLAVFPVDEPDASACAIESCDVSDDANRFIPCRDRAHTGEVRVRLHVAIPQDVSRVLLSYRHERLATMELPLRG